MKTDIATIEKMNPVEIFQGDKLDPILEAIRKEVTAEVPDVKTVKGRERIKSLAYKVSKTKTALDGMGKNLVSKWKEQSKLVDAERKKGRDFLDSLKEEVRKPVTEWEDAEKQRITDIEDRIESIRDHGTNHEPFNSDLLLSVAKLQEKLAELKTFKIDDSFGEFSNEAAQAKDDSVTKLELAIVSRETYEKEQAELERLRAESAEREKKDHEQRIADQAKREAEEAAQKAINDAKAEKERAAKAFEEREAQLERDRIAAAEKAEQDKQDAIKAEQQRQIDQKAREDAEIARREADTKHRRKINNEALAAFEKGGLKKSDAKLAVELIAKKMIANVTINY